MELAVLLKQGQDVNAELLAQLMTLEAANATWQKVEKVLHVTRTLVEQCGAVEARAARFLNRQMEKTA